MTSQPLLTDAKPAEPFRAAMPRPARLGRNFSSLLAAQIWHKLCLGLTAILIAQTFGSDALGRLLAGLSFVFLFWPLIDAGLAELFIRDVAGHPELLGSYARRMIRLKVWLVGAALAAMWTSAALSAVLRRDLLLLTCLSVILIVESFTTLFRCVFRIQERMHLEAVLWAVDGLLKLLVVVFVCAMPSSGDPLLTIAAGWLIVGVFSAFLALWAVRAWLPAPGPAQAESAGEWKALLWRGLPLVMVYTFSLMNVRLVILLLSLRAGPAQAGYFGAGERVLEALQVIPLSLSHVLLPISARLAGSSFAELRALTWRVLAWVSAMALLVTLALVAGAPPAIRFVLGESFESTASLMGLLSWVLFPLCLKPVIEKILYGLHRQDLIWKLYLAVTACTAMAVWFIAPSAGAHGATACLLVAEGASAALLLAGLWRWLLHPGAAGIRMAKPVPVL